MPDYNGILPVDKPEGFTSFDVVAKMRGIARTKKIGHAGTLDPMATGVLPLFLGRAAKACDLLPRQDKRYEALVQLGVATDTLDMTGTVLSRRPAAVLPEQVFAAAEGFRGEIMQVPPMYSALKVGGKKLCDLARRGIEVERKPRPVHIHALSCEAVDVEKGLYKLDVHCSKGTYIRVLAADLGERLGCGAALAGLRRTMAAGFPIEACVTLEQAQDAAGKGCLADLLLPLERVFEPLPPVYLHGGQVRMFLNGVRLDAARVDVQPGMEGRLAVYGDGGLFLGTAFNREGRICLEKLFYLPHTQ